MPSEFVVTPEEYAAFEEAAENFYAMVHVDNLMPGSPEWEATAQLAVAEFPIQSKRSKFAEYLSNKLKKSSGRCSRTGKLTACSERKPVYGRACSLCDKGLKI